MFICDFDDLWDCKRACALRLSVLAMPASLWLLWSWSASRQR